jgi:N-methylhydantoinase B
VKVIVQAARLKDPVTVEIIRHALLAAAEEMMVNLKRTAYGAHIYEVEDCVAGLFDPSGNALALAPGSPMMLCDLGAVIRDGRTKLGTDNMYAGDIIACNDPYVLGGHSSNMTLYSPVYFEGELEGFTATRAHWIDTAGAVPGGKSFDIRDIWQEGFQLRHIKLFSRGQPVADWMRFLADNGRMPETTLGDMRAQVAAARTGERRFIALLEKFGPDMIRAGAEEIFRQGEALARQAVREMPDGVYTAEAFLDNDGVTLGRHVPIRVTIRIAGDQFEVDYSEMSEQVLGPINTGIASAIGIAAFAFKSVTTPHEPPNEGHFRALKVVIPPGKIISATSPAPTSWWSKVTNTTIDTILAAMSQAIPGAIPAAHFGDIPLVINSGRDPRKGGRPFIYFQPIPGGYGARPYEDGENCTNCLHEGAMQNIPYEVEEHQFPVLTEYATFRQDSEGAGRFRGGFGYEAAYRILVEAQLFVGVERSECPPWGLAGGEAAMSNHFSVQEGSAAPQTMLKAQWVKVDSMSRCVIRTGGGGGFGDPLERNPDAVAEDARLGYISRDRARTAYGVALTETFAVDVTATSALRASRSHWT